MKKILVTGGAGYIGSHTVVQLAKSGYEPVVLDNLSNSSAAILPRLEALSGKSLQFYQLDCNDSDSLRNVMALEQPDGVIHFAAFKAVGESVANPLRYYRNNIGGMISLLEVMAEFRVRNLVFSSSCTVYGQPEILPASERSPLQEANSPYGYTKQVCERMTEDAVKAGAGKLGAVLLRYFNPIGAHPEGVIGELPLGVPANLVPYLTQAAAGLRDKLTVFGNDYATPDGSCIRDYIHVMDLADAHIKALEWVNQHSGECRAFNVGTGKGHSVLEVIHRFEALTGVNVPFEIGPRRPGDVEQIWAEVELARNELGWRASRGLDDMLQDAWNWQVQLKDFAWSETHG